MSNLRCAPRCAIWGNPVSTVRLCRGDSLRGLASRRRQGPIRAESSCRSRCKAPREAPGADGRCPLHERPVRSAAASIGARRMRRTWASRRVGAGVPVRADSLRKGIRRVAWLGMARELESGDLDRSNRSPEVGETARPQGLCRPAPLRAVRPAFFGAAEDFVGENQLPCSAGARQRGHQLGHHRRGDCYLHGRLGALVQ